MKLLFFAVAATPPWTEGRKNLVRDLSSEYRDRGYFVEVISGFAGCSQGLMILTALIKLVVLLFRDSDRIVVQFPYGRFSGWRGVVNRVIAKSVYLIARLFSVLPLTVLYSADGVSLTQAVKRYRFVAAVGASHQGVYPLRLGTPLTVSTSANLSVKDGSISLLFLCGYQHATKGAFASVLHERGLLRLFEACAGLDHTVSLTVAIPFLRDKGVCERLQQLARSICPAIKLRLDGEISPSHALATHTLFIFPYILEQEVFIPTSMLEAMMIGIPVIACDRRMYRSLTVSAEGARCGLPSDDTADGLCAEIKKNIADFPATKARAELAQASVMREWTIKQAADDVLSALRVSSSV